jgi:hypothetical protein
MVRKIFSVFLQRQHEEFGSGVTVGSMMVALLTQVRWRRGPWGVGEKLGEKLGETSKQ